MPSLIRFLPSTRRGRAAAVSAVILAAAAVGGIVGTFAGDAWTAALGAGTAALVLLTALRAELLARRHRQAPLAPRLAKQLGQVPASVAALQHTVDRQAMQLKHTASQVEQVSSTAATHREVVATFEQIQAFIQLRGRVDDPPIVPAMRGWAASPDVVLHLVNLLIRHRPAVVVECGSGVSTTWLAAAARQHSPGTRIVALDHDPQFAEYTRENLRENGLAAWAEVRDAPLEPFGPDGPRWYSVEALRGLADVGLVFVDGPPAATGPLARMPALEALSAVLHPEAVIVLDDTRRRDEQAIVAAWLQTRPDLTERTYRFEKGAIELRLTAPVAPATSLDPRA